ncbi:MAG: hypothetical protein R3252_03885 [Robiginitalea sp.]|nr:hypothetical protein [Robiginitalea sp.]
MGIATLAVQDLGSLKAAAAEATTSDSMIEQLAGSQVRSLAQKFNLSEAQAEQSSAVVRQMMKTPLFKEILGKYAPDQLLSGSGAEMLQGALLGNRDFMGGMEEIVSADQLGLIKKAASTVN